MTQLFFYLPTLKNLPAQPNLEAGYAIRTFEPGDEKAWESICFEAFHNPDHVFDMLKNEEAFDPKRIFFVTHHGVPVGTISAWYRAQYGQDCGYMHMLACKAGHRGKGLGYALVMAALHDFIRQGRTGVILSTDDERLQAIKLYIGLGFQIQLMDETTPRRMARVLEQLEQGGAAHA